MMNYIRVFERRFIPRLRNNKWYKISKYILLFPVVCVYYAIHKLAEYVKLKVRRAERVSSTIKLSNIIDGWMNLIIEDPVTEEIATRRANICAECPFAELVGGLYTIVVDNKTKQIRGLKCTQCGCPLSAKVRSSDDYCPIGLW